MLRGVIREILATDPSIEIVGEVFANGEAIAAIENSDADVVIYGTDDRDLSPAWWHALCGNPRAKVVALVDQGQQAFLFELRPRREELGELSPHGLIAAVRRGEAPEEAS